MEPSSTPPPSLSSPSPPSPSGPSSPPALWLRAGVGLGGPAAIAAIAIFSPVSEPLKLGKEVVIPLAVIAMVCIVLCVAPLESLTTFVRSVVPWGRNGSSAK